MTIDVDQLLLAEESSSAESATAAPPPQRLGLVALTVDVLVHPAAAFGRLAEHPGRRWVAPVVVLVLLSTALGLALAFSPKALGLAQAQVAARMSSSGAQLSAEQMAQVEQFQASGMVRAFGAIGALLAGLVGTVLGLLVVAALFHFLGTVMGGQQSFTQMFTVIAWAGIPVILGLVVKLVAALAGNYDPSPAGLSGLVGDPVAGQPSVLAPLLGQIELWHLWSLALYALAIRAVSRISLAKAALAVLVLVLLQVAVGLAGVYLSRALSGMAGG
jgi:MFS family permease